MQMRTKLIEFIDLNQNSVTDKTIVWASIKGFIRNNAIWFSTYLHKTKLKKISTLEKQCYILEKDLKKGYTEAKESDLKIEQAELNNLIRSRAEYMIHITKHKYYAEGRRPSRLLALTLKHQEAKMNIPAIRCDGRGVVSSTEEINETFKNFFKDINMCGPVPSGDDFTKFFSELELPTLPPDDIKSLDSPVSLNELLKAVKSTNKGPNQE